MATKKELIKECNTKHNAIIDLQDMLDAAREEAESFERDLDKEILKNADLKAVISRGEGQVDTYKEIIDKLLDVIMLGPDTSSKDSRYDPSIFVK